MQCVVIGRRVIISHIKPCRLTLHKIAHIVNQPLSKYVVIDAVESCHNTVEQEYGDHHQQIGQTDGGRQHTLHGIGHAIDQEFENIQVGKWQQAGKEHIEESAQERRRVAPAHHHQGLPQVPHVSLSLFSLSLHPQAPRSSSGAGSRVEESSPGARRQRHI